MSRSLLVPHFQQQADGYCLPACVQMVLAYWGETRKQSRLARQLKTVAGAGTPGSRIMLLVSRRYDIHYSEGALEDLRTALEQNIPPIVLVNTRHFDYWAVATGHAVVVTGMDEMTATINDPGIAQGGTQVNVGDLYLAWDDVENLYGLIRRK